MIRTVLIIFMASTLIGCNRPASHDALLDCILSKTSTASDEDVAMMLRDTCAKKYQSEMPGYAIEKLELGNASFSKYIKPSFTIRNRNSDWVLTQIEFSVSTDTKSANKPYRQNVYVEPLNEEYFYREIDNPPVEERNYPWGLIKAWGIPVK